MDADKLWLVPVGPASPELLAWLGERLRETFGRPWAVARGEELLPEVYDASRRQYLSDPLLARLRLLPLAEAWRVLGVVEADLHPGPELCLRAGLARRPTRSDRPRPIAPLLLWPAGG